MIDFGTGAILAAIGIEAWLGYRQSRSQTALLSAIFVELARRNAGGRWRPGWPSRMNGRLLGYEQQPEYRPQHQTEGEQLS